MTIPFLITNFCFYIALLLRIDSKPAYMQLIFVGIGVISAFFALAKEIKVTTIIDEIKEIATKIIEAIKNASKE